MKKTDFDGGYVAGAAWFDGFDGLCYLEKELSGFKQSSFRYL